MQISTLHIPYNLCRKLLLFFVLVSVNPVICHAQTFSQVRLPWSTLRQYFPNSGHVTERTFDLSDDELSLINHQLPKESKLDDRHIRVLFVQSRLSSSQQDGLLLPLQEMSASGLIQMTFVFNHSLEMIGVQIQQGARGKPNGLITALKPIITQQPATTLSRWFTSAGDTLTKPIPQLAIDAQPEGLAILRAAQRARLLMDMVIRRLKQSLY